MSQKIKVLMVDDEPRFRQTTSSLLTKKGFETTIAASGEEAIEIISKNRQDVVVLDVKMEGMDGHQALAEIKRISPETQVIMLTGHGTADSARDSKELDAFDYLSKPCDIDLLAMKINEAHAVKKTGADRVEKKVRDIMTSIEEYSSVSVNETVREAIGKLLRSLDELASSSRIREGGHRALLVFDEKQKLVGLLTIKELIKAVRPYYLSPPKSTQAEMVRFSPVFRDAWDGVFTIQMRMLADKKVGEVKMDPSPMIDEGANLMEVVELIFKTGATRLVVTSNGKVTGILREQDLFFEIINLIM